MLRTTNGPSKIVRKTKHSSFFYYDTENDHLTKLNSEISSINSLSSVPND